MRESNETMKQETSFEINKVEKVEKLIYKLIGCRDKYAHIKLEKLHVVRLGELIIKQLKSSKNETKECSNFNNLLFKNNICNMDFIVDDFLEKTEKYFLDEKTNTWFPNNLGVFIGDVIINYSNFEMYRVDFDDYKYVLFELETNEQFGGSYDSIRDMVDDLFEGEYREIMNL